MPKRIIKKGETPDLQHTALYHEITQIETDIIRRIQELKKSSKMSQCEHFDIRSGECEPYNPNINYYDKFWKRFLLNEMGKHNLKQYNQSTNYLMKRLKKIEVLISERERLYEPHLRKKNKSDQSSGEFQCQICHRNYEEESILNTHIKIKHQHQDISEARIFPEDHYQDIYDQ